MSVISALTGMTPFALVYALHELEAGNALDDDSVGDDGRAPQCLEHRSARREIAREQALPKAVARKDRWPARRMRT